MPPVSVKGHSARPASVPRWHFRSGASHAEGRHAAWKALRVTMPFPKLLATTAPNATILVRILVGAVFLSEGIQKFLFSAALGVGRFEKIGIPSPVIAAPFVGMIEVICRETVDRGIADSRCVGRSVAEYFPSRSCPPRFLSCLGRDSGGSVCRRWRATDFGSMAHEARTDFRMFMGSAFLLIVGGGSWSLDWMLARK